MMKVAGTAVGTKPILPTPVRQLTFALLKESAPVDVRIDDARPVEGPCHRPGLLTVGGV